MLPRRSSEEDSSGRRRNQFSKDERLRLLSIMSQYAPLLDDKSASVFDRREIWRAIERDFHQAGFTGKTSAQLKKYWQNYKYHGRRAQTGIRKHSTSNEVMEEAPNPEVPETRGNLEMTTITKKSATPCVPARPDASLWNIIEGGCRQRQIYEDNGTFFRKLNATPILPTDLDSLGKNRSSSEISQRKRFSSKVYEESRSSDVIDRKPEKPIGTDVIVSNTDVSDNSVTVSVICPERSPELFSRSQPKRKREGDAPVDRSSFQCSVSVASDKSLACRGATKKFHLFVQSPAASPSKKIKDDDHSIFPAVAGATKGRCFLLQPRQTDNHGEVISNRRNAVETRRKLEPANKESIVLPSKFASRNEVSCSRSARKIFAIEADSPKEDFAVSHDQDIGNSNYKGRRGESKIREDATLRNQPDDFDETANDATARTRIPNATLWDWDTAGLVQSELRDELSYRLMLHRLETEEKRLKVKIAEMAIQEIRFRIRALNEDIRRADELHELHLALATAQADAQGLHV